LRGLVFVLDFREQQVRRRLSTHWNLAQRQ
jgi:hypothetical protein